LILRSTTEPHCPCDSLQKWEVNGCIKKHKLYNKKANCGKYSSGRKTNLEYSQQTFGYLAFCYKFCDCNAHNKSNLHSCSRLHANQLFPMHILNNLSFISPPKASVNLTRRYSCRYLSFSRCKLQTLQTAGLVAMLGNVVHADP